MAGKFTKVPTKPTKPPVRLTKAVVQGLSAPSKGYLLTWDKDLKGFGIRVTARGAKSWVLQTRIKGRSRRLTIGRYPGVQPEVARTKATKLVGQVANDGDPVADKARQKIAGITLERAFTEYTETRRRRDGKALKDRTRADMLAALDESFEDWKSRPITGINREMVKRRYGERVAVSPARANVAFRYLRAVMYYAVASYRDSENRPVLTDNPVSVLSEARLWHGLAARTRTMSPDALKAWVPVVLALAEIPDRAPGKGKEVPRLRHGEVFRDLLLFLALTACRRSEALELRVSDVDLTAGTIRFPDTKNRRDHVLPLTPYLRTMLERRLRLAKGPLVFSSPFDGAPVSNLRVALERVRTGSKIPFSPHDLRRLAATTMERLSVPAYTIKAVLNHVSEATDITGQYVRVDEDMKLDALTKLEGFILGTGKQARKVGNLRSVK